MWLLIQFLRSCLLLVQGLFRKGGGASALRGFRIPEVGVVSPEPGWKINSRVSPSCYSLTQIFEYSRFNNTTFYRLGIISLQLVPVIMSSVPLKRLYKELPVWIVEDHHDVSLAPWQALTRYCPLFLVKRRFTKGKTG